MDLGERLSAISEFVKQDAKIADIGADHGKLPIYLMQEKKISYAVAVDKNEGPLFSAKENIVRAGLSERIELRLGDGLKSLAPNEVDTIIIAGMGGALITQILTEAPQILETTQNIVLQPMNEGKTVRRWLQKNNWRTENEVLVKEDNRIYEIISAVHGKTDELTDMELLFGAKILRDKTELLKERVKEFIHKEKQKISGMEKSENAKNSEEYFMAKNTLEKLEELLW